MVMTPQMNWFPEVQALQSLRSSFSLSLSLSVNIYTYILDMNIYIYIYHIYIYIYIIIVYRYTYTQKNNIYMYLLHRCLDISCNPNSTPNPPPELTCQERSHGGTTFARVHSYCTDCPRVVEKICCRLPAFPKYGR